MNKRFFRISLCIFFVLLTVIVLSTNVIAVISPSNVPGNGSVGDSDIMNIGNDIVTVIKNIGIVVSVAVILVLGIKYMLGSAEEKAEYKKTMLPYFIGAILLFAGSSIVTVLQTIGQNIKTT